MATTDTKTVFLTGASSGINLAIAKHFADLGMNISILARNVDKLTAAKKEIEDRGAKCLIFPADVRNYDEVAKAFGDTANTLGPIDTVIAGAAGNFVAPAQAISSNGFRSVLEIDTLGTFHTMKASFEHLRKNQACLIAISAPQAVVPYLAQSHVSTAKAGIDMMIKSLALEWGRFGIRVLGISPGPIEDTEGLERLAPSATAKEKIAKVTPIQRLGTKKDVACLTAFLASDQANYITGTTIPCDGGIQLIGPIAFG